MSELEIDIQRKYDIVFVAFIGFVMSLKGCGRDEAIGIIAALCTVVEQEMLKQKQN